MQARGVSRTRKLLAVFRAGDLCECPARVLLLLQDWARTSLAQQPIKTDDQQSESSCPNATGNQVIQRVPGR